MINDRRNSVTYQIYPRSYQDSNGDGIGDLKGITGRLDHIASLGVDAVWLSPIFPSPNADFGYDVSDYTSIDPIYGTTEDLEELVARAHALNLAVMLDIVPCHTSIEHPWFKEHPDWYIWSPTDGPPNNWVSVFGGSAWTEDPDGRGWYLHTFYPEQPNLNWRNPAVVEAMGDALKFWVDRGIDGFRIDAVQALFIDESLTDNPTDDHHVLHSIAMSGQNNMINRPEISGALASMRAAVPEAFLIVEAGVLTELLPKYVKDMDLAFCFEFLQSPLDVERLRKVITEATAVDGMAWVVSNHDFSRLVTRWGNDKARIAALMLLTLPGAAFVYQGDEIGMLDGPGGDDVYDRFGRDAFRHPMQWTKDGGFSDGRPWLPMTDPERCNVADQEGDDTSMLALYRSLISTRRELSGPFEMLDLGSDVLAYRRGRHVVVVNVGTSPVSLDFGGEVVIATDGSTSADTVAPFAGVLLATT